MTDHRRGTIGRRQALAWLALGTTALVTGCAGRQTRRAAPTEADAPGGFSMKALAGNHQVVPLPFRATSLRGLSERMIVSHHDNNYGGAVKNLNRVEAELARTAGDTPPFVVAALRDRELTFRNSKTLHEAYFANLGGDGKRSGRIEAALAAAYGSSARWEETFRMTGLGLGGGSGWVILALELDGGGLRTIGSGGHTQALATSVPLLVMDMYEHSYQIDYGAAAPAYIDAFFANVQWDEVNARFDRAERLSAAFAG